ncbi:hypothetical protein ACIRP0_19790 [Streptomyces sp. NPDC101733]
MARSRPVRRRGYRRAGLPAAATLLLAALCAGTATAAGPGVSVPYALADS